MEKQISALIFDAEGVVIDTMHTVWIPADVEFCHRRGFSCPNELLIKLAGTTLLEGVGIIKKFHHFDGDDQQLLRERIEISDELFKKNVTFVNGFMDFFNAHRDLPAAIATSLRSEYLTIVDQRLHLQQLFNNHVYSIYEVGVKAKPNPDIFLHAAKQLHVPPAHCLVFEDAPNGIEAANRAGMRSVGLTTTFDKKFLSAATLIVDGFTDDRLLKILQ